MYRTTGGLLAFLFVASCGVPEQWPTKSVVYDYPIRTDIFPEEVCAVAAVESAIPHILAEARKIYWQDPAFAADSEPFLPYWNKGGIFFIRRSDQKIPEICGSGGCTEVWSGVPGVIGIPEGDAGYGYGGIYASGYVFVSRIVKDKSASHMFYLVAHERWHEVTPGHGHNDFFLKSLQLLSAEAIRLAKSGQIAECTAFANLL